MDNTARKLSQPVDQLQPQVQSQTPVAPVGAVNKEVQVPVGDYVVPAAEVAPIVKDNEVAEAGVREVEDKIKLEEVHEKIGVKQSAESVEVKTEPTKIAIQSLMTPEEIKADLKKTGTFNITGHYLGIYIANSRDFLAKLLDKILRKQASQPA
jgi:hypothetical protein